MRNKDVTAVKNAIEEKLKIYKSEQIPKYKELDLDYYPVLEKCKNDDHMYERFLDDALFLKDYVYDSKEYISAHKGMRSFCDMNIDNLRTYVLWRSYIRRGEFFKVSNEYILIYINELLNLVGVTPNEGLDKLIFLWEKSDDIDNEEFYKIIKDYCILHAPCPFNDVISKFPAKYDCNLHVEERIYDGEFIDCITYFNDRSAQHQIIGSSFYNSEKGKVLDYLLPFVMKEVNEYYKEKGYEFTKMILVKEKHVYPLFNDNPFVKVKNISRDYYITKYEHYYSSEGEVYSEKLYQNSLHNKLISHLLKVTESRVRENLEGKPLKIHKSSLYPKQYKEFESLCNDELQTRIIKVIDSYLKNNIDDQVDDKEIKKAIDDNFSNILKQMKLLSFAEGGRIYGSELFERQVKFFEKIEYNADVKYVSFENNSPSYSIMSDEMLKSYFSFRTKVRKGIFEKVDIGYVKLYLNEIMLLCDCKDSNDAFVKFTDFWKGMRLYVKNIDTLMESAIKEFYIFNEVDVAYIKICEMYPEGYISSNQLDEEILTGNYTNFYTFATRRLNSKFSKENALVLTNFLPEVLKRIDKYLEKAHYSIKQLLFGEIISIRRNELVAGYLINHTNSVRKKAVVLSKNEKYLFEDKYVIKSTLNIGSRENKFTEYILNLATDIIKNNALSYSLIFGGSECYSYHAQLIESVDFINIFKDVYDEFKLKTAQRSNVINVKKNSFSYGERVFYYDKEVAGDLSDLLSRQNYNIIKKYDTLNIFEYINRMSDYSYYKYMYHRGNYRNILFLVKAIIIESLENINKVDLPKDKYGIERNKVYSFGYYNELSAYLYWRTRVRKGIVDECNLDYVLNYISEVINLIGFKNEDDAFAALITFWHNYREYDKNYIDPLIESAVRGFAIYYNTGYSYSDIRSKYPNDYKFSYAALYDVYISQYEAVSQLVLEKSPHRYVDTAFGVSEYGHLLGECMPYILKGVDKLFREYDFSLPYLILGAMYSKKYEPFDYFEFVKLDKYKEFEVINDHDIYSCDRYGVFVRTSNYSDDVSLEFCGIITKLTEIAFRELLSFRGKLKSPLIKTEKMSRVIVKLIDTIGENKITECVTHTVHQFCKQNGYYIGEDKEIKQFEPVKVEIDFTKLDSIRKVSDELCDKLVIDEEDVFTKEKPEIIEKCVTHTEVYGTIEDNPWKAFFLSLKEIHIKVIDALLNCEDVNNVAREAFVLPEVIIEEINELSLQYIGDTVIDTDCTIIEDYIEDVKSNIEKG